MSTDQIDQIIAEETQKLETLLASIGRDHFPPLRERGFKTLDAKGNSQDFFEVAVWAIKNALEEAYTCGWADAETAHGLNA